ncbi:MAG: hypothetical protein E6I73_16875 [Chloroflexi bacterium]|nr:MAG: hypothetical protein E6I73_16875 [Chloroflexota bacterium]
MDAPGLVLVEAGRRAVPRRQRRLAPLDGDAALDVLRTVAERLVDGHEDAVRSALGEPVEPDAAPGVGLDREDADPSSGRIEGGGERVVGIGGAGEQDVALVDRARESHAADEWRGPHPSAGVAPGEDHEGLPAEELPELVGDEVEHTPADLGGHSLDPRPALHRTLALVEHSPALD